MFKKILIGVDGSDHSLDAALLARDLAGEGSTLTLAHVHPGRLHPLHAVQPDVVAEEQKRSDEMLRRVREESGIDAELVSIVAETAPEGLHSEAEESGFDLIVVGSCGRGAFGRVMVGDHARGALNGAPCAVAVASRGYAHHAEPGKTKGRIGVAYNESAEAEDALAVGRELAAARGVPLKALEVVAIPTYAYTELAATDTGVGLEALLKDANDRVAKIEGVEARAEYGLAGEQLAAFGDELDLLIIGSRSYGPVKRLVLGSTSDYLERHGRCSLLVLPRRNVEAA
jgi:nucleotide-binding universal stress UspA family protein